MGSQRTFASMAWNTKGKVTRREQFLAEMDAVIPWARLLRLIEPHYPKAGDGRQPLGLEKMLRVYFLQQWFNLSDPGAEDAIYDSESMRRFARVEMGEDVGAPGEAWERRMRRTETFRWDPAGNQSRPERLASHPEASLAWRWSNPHCEA